MCQWYGWYSWSGLLNYFPIRKSWIWLCCKSLKTLRGAYLHGDSLTVLHSSVVAHVCCLRFSFMQEAFTDAHVTASCSIRDISSLNHLQIFPFCRKMKPIFKTHPFSSSRSCVMKCTGCARPYIPNITWFLSSANLQVHCDVLLEVLTTFSSPLIFFPTSFVTFQ